MSELLTVHSPLGYPPKVVARGMAPGLDTLEGKRLFLVDIGFENSDNFMLVVQDWFNANLPQTTTEVVRWKDQHAPDPQLCERIKSEGAAALLGVGT